MDEKAKPGEKATPDKPIQQHEPSHSDLHHRAGLNLADLPELDASLPAGRVPALSKQMTLGGDYWYATRYPLGRAYALKPGTAVTVDPFAVSDPFLTQRQWPGQCGQPPAVRVVGRVVHS